MSSTAVGTFKYMSPERLLGQQYDKSADIWSLGILIVELWTKAYPFEYCCQTPIDLIAELETFHFEEMIPEDQFPYYLREVIRMILVFEPNQRISCKQLISCEWFAMHGIETLEDAHGVRSSHVT